MKQGEYTLVRVDNVGCRALPLVFGGAWGTSPDIYNSDAYYDPTYHEKVYEYFASIRVCGPGFYPAETGENRILVDQMFLSDKKGPE